MKRNLLWLSAMVMLTLAFTSCQKENLLPNDAQSGKLTAKGKLSNSLDALSLTTPSTPATCGTATTVNLVDNYPNQYYLTYGTVKVSNDANNVYITLTSLTQYNFAFTKIQLTIGDLAHLTTMVPYFDYPLGPPTADYVQNFTNPVTTYTFTIPRTSIKTPCFNIYLWAREATPNNSDFKFVWVQSSTRVTSNQDSQYMNYCLQACTIGGGKGGDCDDHGKGKDKDKDDDHDKGHDKDKDHGDNDHDKGHDKDKDHGDNDHDKGHDKDKDHRENDHDKGHDKD